MKHCLTGEMPSLKYHDLTPACSNPSCKRWFIKVYCTHSLWVKGESRGKAGAPPTRPVFFTNLPDQSGHDLVFSI